MIWVAEHLIYWLGPNPKWGLSAGVWDGVGGVVLGVADDLRQRGMNWLACLCPVHPAAFLILRM
jgi:hypothetical protein